MRLQAVPFDADTHTAADWMEMKAILGPKDRLSFTDIERAWEANRESEDQDPGGGFEQFDEWLNARVMIIQRRIELLGESYPFEFSDDDTALRFKGDAEIADGEAVYLLCLFLSVARDTSVFVDPIPITPWMRDAFQACSGWAAAGSIDGSSYVFGWPRVDGSDFQVALHDVFVTLMADGEIVPHSNAPAGSAGREKDAGIDVIAWKERIDKSSGKLNLFGQVASGANWRDKPISPYIDALQKNWLASPWIIPPQPAMFIPFSIVPLFGATYREQVRYFSAMYGSIFYREILPAYAARGLLLERSGSIFCHRSNELPRLIAREKAFIKVLRRTQDYS
ncbi:hypothetical protein XSP_001033 [Xanthomonas euroxanthea]|uniref:Uncharacterized protein n=1 Tax=Xanthomonas euroxanthea TaxID=2259622 RepID=A0A8E4EL82_9XANT|nr:hypothetical protein [Xanthomonas euroxanthea]CAD1788706.1 hypothetical protein XSP_001033 [Xanthomonas euroxanthea]SYZ52234.1 hypothetical protein CPBF367_10380 [Xanthomonas arboricola pv. juglandis]